MDFVEGQREQSRLVFKRGSVVSAIGPCFYTKIIRARVRRSQADSVDFTKAGTYNVLMPRQKKKNAAAVALGRKGARKGGLARAASMTPEERSESARQAVAARWERYREKMARKRTG
jgi:hypothetical protein